jgi:CelD/BcsL family acetyltransferase involved in cellulose biosynthesis
LEFILNVTAYTTPDAFDTLRPTWEALVPHSTANTPFSLWAWTVSWWEAYQPGDLWLLTVQHDNETIGIAPFFIQTADTGRTVRFIGHIDVVDYLDIIAHTDHRAAVYQQIAAFLAAHTDHFDHIGLANIREASPTYTELPAALNACGFSVSFEQNDVAPQFALPDTYDTYLQDILASKERKETKRKMRKAESGLYDVQWYRVDDNHDLTTELDRFLGLMATADADKAAFLQNPQHVDFFKRVMPPMYDAGLLELIFLTIDDNPCAAYLNLNHNDRVYVYNSGLDASQYGALSPGIVLLQYAIQHAITNNHAVFDFLRGDETYKYKMGGTDTRIFQINASYQGK